MDDFNLAVCPHDTVRNSEGWFRLVQYLSYRMSAKIHFQISLDFADFHSTYATADLVYASPSDAVTLIDQHSYNPLLCPIGAYDEALLVTGPDAPLAGLESLHGASVATVKSLLPTKLALRMLSSQGITPGDLHGCDSWLAVVRAVWNGDAPYGILYRDAYDELSPQGKAMVQVIGATNERAAFHMLCCGPKTRTCCDDLKATLLGMPDDTLGKEVLGDLHFSGWQPVTDEALDVVRTIKKG